MDPNRRVSGVPSTGIRKQLLAVRLPLEARIAQGRMTVRDLLDMGPETLVRSDSPPGGGVLLCCGRVVLASAEPVVQQAKLLLRIEEVEKPRA